MNVNWLDLILLVILGLSVLFGVLKGFVRQIVGILAVIVGLILAVNYYQGVSEFIMKWIRISTLSHFIAFIVIFIAS